MKNLKNVSLLLFVIFVISIFGQTVTASNQNSSSESHELPILKTTPSNLESVLTDKDIKIFIDKNHKNFNRFRNHFEKEKYEVLINGTTVNSLFDKNELSINILDYKLEVYNVYDLEIRLKAEKNSEASNSGNAHYSFRFYTVLNELQHMSLIKDEYGNSYKVIGYSENVKDVKIYDAKLDIDSMIDKSRRYPVSAPGSLFIDVPDDIGRVRLITGFDAEPQRVLRYNEGEDNFKLIPFSIGEKGELEFYVVEDTCFIPVRYVEENLSQSKNLSLNTITRMSALSINGSYSGDKYFNILENEDGYLKVDITDLVNNTKSNWFAGKPSIYAKITDQKGDTKNINVSGNIIEHTFNKSGIYRVEVMEDDPLFDDVIWEQDVFVQMPFYLTDNQIANLAEKFSPIILYNNEEEYYPMSLDDIFSEIGKLDGSVDFDGVFGRKEVPFSEVGQFMAYNGHYEYLFSTSNRMVSTDFKGITGSKNSAVVYYSYFENEDKFFINYHFLYAYDPKTGTSTKPALGSHNFDRESMTLEFSKSSNIENITPENVIVGGHTDGQEITLKGNNNWLTGDTYESWKNVRVKLPYEEFKSPYSNHVVVNIAKGSHAIYPVSGWYKVLTLVEPAGITDSILSGNRLNISNERVLFPRDSQFSGEATYTLSNSNMDNLKGGNPLIFSGDWVDLMGPGNEKFPPFTDREKDIPGWCKNASGFDLSNIPAVSKRTIEEFNKAYLFTKQTVKDLVASQDSRGIILDWTSFDGISKYKIYKRNYSGQLIETKEVAYSNYTDSDVVSGQNYIYEIEGIFKLKTDSGTTVEIACKKAAISVRYNSMIGKIKGTVKSAINNQPIANAVISVDNGAGTSIKTDSGGNFEVAVTADESHTLTVSKSGYTSVTYYNIQVDENETVHVETILQIPEEYADKTGT